MSSPPTTSVTVTPTGIHRKPFQGGGEGSGQPSVSVSLASIRDAFQAQRSKLNDGMDELIDGVARLQTQLQQLTVKGGNAVKTIKEHVRDETEEFATAAIFISLRLQQLWTASLGDVATTTEVSLTSDASKCVSEPAFDCIRILQNSCDVLKARLKWAESLGPHSHVDTAVLRAYSVEEFEASGVGTEPSTTTSLFTSIKQAATELGSRVHKHPVASAVACVAAGVLTAAWFYGKHYVPMRHALETEELVNDFMRGESIVKQTQAFNEAHWMVTEAGYKQDMKHVVRSGTFCSLAAVGVSALGVKYLDELGSTVVHDNDPIALTSIFLMKLNQVRETCRSSVGVTIPSILLSLEECWTLLLAYMAFTDLRECCICREIVTPMDVLVSSDGGPSDCSDKHLFHEHCLPLEYALRAGCPVCRRPITAFQTVRLDPLFKLQPAPT